MEIVSTKLAALLGDDFELASNLYGIDAEFTEICGDYLSLSVLTPSDALMADQIEDSLSGLEDEIHRYLRKLKSRTKT